MPKEMNLFKKILHALRGLRLAIEKEKSLRTQLLLSLIVIGVAILLRISTMESIILFLAIGLVLTAELLNTVIEDICDLYTLENNVKIKKIKDISAGAVLTSCVFALIIGIIIFLPHVKTLTNF